MKTTGSLKKEYGWLLWPIVITTLAVVVAALLIASDRSGTYNVRIELAKLLIQLVLIVIGGVLYPSSFKVLIGDVNEIWLRMNLEEQLSVD